jgi:uncharacterized protein YjiS (DUF1127 family)
MADTTHPTLTNFQVSLHWPAGRRRGLALRFWDLLRVWHQRQQERAQLARLDSRALRDFGRNEADVSQEMAKWFWQA